MGAVLHVPEIGLETGHSTKKYSGDPVSLCLWVLSYSELIVGMQLADVIDVSDVRELTLSMEYTSSPLCPLSLNRMNWLGAGGAFYGRVLGARSSRECRSVVVADVVNRFTFCGWCWIAGFVSREEARGAGLEYGDLMFSPNLLVWVATSLEEGACILGTSPSSWTPSVSYAG